MREAEEKPVEALMSCTNSAERSTLESSRAPPMTRAAEEAPGVVMTAVPELGPSP